MSNLQEYWAGTDPTNPASVLMMTMPPTANGSGTGLVVRWWSVAGKQYHLDRTTNIKAGFSTIASNIAATAPQNVYTDVTATGSATFIYRVKTP
jgi:hypothetical protein